MSPLRNWYWTEIQGAAPAEVAGHAHGILRRRVDDVVSDHPVGAHYERLVDLSLQEAEGVDEPLSHVRWSGRDVASLVTGGAARVHTKDKRDPELRVRHDASPRRSG